MQGNGFKILITVFFLVLSGWYLFPTAQNFYYQRQLDNLEGAERQAYLEANYEAINRAQERSLKLGLDLQGGMHVTLEVRVDELLRGLAQDQDEMFEEVLQAAVQRADAERTNLITVFVEEFEERDPNARLSRYFRNPDEEITRRSSNSEIASYLNSQAEEAVGRAIEIVRNRVDRFGVAEPAIQRQGTQRIVVELPGIDDPERVRNLLRGTAVLEFRLMADPDELTRSLQDIITFFEDYEDALEDEELEELLVEGEEAAEGAEEVDPLPQPQDAESQQPQVQDLDAEEQEVQDPTDEPQVQDPTDPDAALDELLQADPGEMETGNPLLDVMTPIGQGVVFGFVSERDTSVVNRLLAIPEVQEMLPPGIELLYASRVVQTAADGSDVLQIVGVRTETELAGETVTNARVDFDEANRPQVSLTMDSEGARIWARITGANVQRHVAIVLDDVVHSFPVIQDRIAGGRTAITGLDSRAEAQDIVTVLMSGALPAPVDIVQERVVGPTLGAESIRAGLMSVLFGLLLVTLFMIVYYRTGGVVADMALLINIIFILGILAGFEATLTLPGVAGIVLTIGMAVDANVLIFDRIREEQNAGKTLRAAIDGGYNKALSAIFDANITTFFVAIILYSFGVGPIQGFAVTLMAGILASLFSAIVFTRIIFDHMVDERRMQVSYG